MIKQDWMKIVAGEKLVDELTAARKAQVARTAAGYNSEDLCKLQVAEAGRGILGAEIVKSLYGCSVRYDSGLQNWGIIAGCRNGSLDGSYEAAVEYAKKWVAQDPTRRYAWHRTGGKYDPA